MTLDRNAKIVQALLCFWLVGAQIWYYLQFKDLLRVAAVPLLRKLWH